MYPLYCSPTCGVRPSCLAASFAFSLCRGCAQCASLVPRLPVPFTFWLAALSRRGWGLWLLCGVAVCKSFYLSSKFCAKVGPSCRETATDVDRYCDLMSSNRPNWHIKFFQRSAHHIKPVLQHCQGVVLWGGAGGPWRECTTLSSWFWLVGLQMAIYQLELCFMAD